MWEKTLISPDTSLAKAIEIIDQTGLQIALVIDQERHLIGTVTDGDVRRAILRHMTLNQPVIKAMNSNPSYVCSEQARENAVLIMKQKKLRQIPVLNRDKQVIGLEIADDLIHLPVRSNWVILMAGGMGKRLQPLTDACPKPLLKVGDKPVLETILESFIEQGFKRFYISVNYMAHMIMDYFGDGSKWAVEIVYLNEPYPLGTAGPLAMLPVKPQEPVLLMNGDVLTKVNYRKLLEFHVENMTSATMCIKQQYNQIPYGVVKIYNNRLQQIIEKPSQHIFVNAGLYIFNPEILSYVPRGKRCDIPDLFKLLLDEGKEIAVFPIREYWIDIGRFDEYERANHEFGEVFG